MWQHQVATIIGAIAVFVLLVGIGGSLFPQFLSVESKKKMAIVDN